MGSKRSPSDVAERVGRRIREDAARTGRTMSQSEASAEARARLSRYDRKNDKG